MSAAPVVPKRHSTSRVSKERTLYRCNQQQPPSEYHGRHSHCPLPIGSTVFTSGASGLPRPHPDPTEDLQGGLVSRKRKCHSIMSSKLVAIQRQCATPPFAPFPPATNPTNQKAPDSRNAPIQHQPLAPTRQKAYPGWDQARHDKHGQYGPKLGPVDRTAGRR